MEETCNSRKAGALVDAVTVHIALGKGLGYATYAANLCPFIFSKCTPE